MFPPKHTESKEEVIDNLLSSLQRAGLEFMGWGWLAQGNRPAGVLYSMPPKEAVASMKRYARMYLKASGWKLTELRVVKCRLFLDAEKLTPSDGRSPGHATSTSSPSPSSAG